MSVASLGLNALNRPVPVTYPQGGAGFLDSLKKANEWAKRHKIISKIGAVGDAVGATDYLNKKTGGYYGKAVTEGKKRGYGKKRGTRKRRTTHRR